MDRQDYEDAKLRKAVEQLPRMEKEASVVEAAERQMQQWLFLHKGSEKAASALEARTSFGPYLTISREAGAGGGQIARLVGEAVGWEVLDRKLLECVAETYHTSPAVLELVDETTTNWITELFGHWIDPTSVSQMQYICRVSRVILMAARAGKVIFVGRGAIRTAPRARPTRPHRRPAEVSDQADHGSPACGFRGSPRLRGKDGRQSGRVRATVLPSRHCRSAPIRLRGQRREAWAGMRRPRDCRRPGDVLQCPSVALRGCLSFRDAAGGKRGRAFAHSTSSGGNCRDWHADCTMSCSDRSLAMRTVTTVPGEES